MIKKLWGHGKGSAVGGEIYRNRAKKLRIFYFIVGLIGFLLLNLILYSLTKI